MGVVSCGIGGLVVAHVGRRLLLGRSGRQCAMPPHNGNLFRYRCANGILETKAKDESIDELVRIVYYESTRTNSLCNVTRQNRETRSVGKGHDFAGVMIFVGVC